MRKLVLLMLITIATLSACGVKGQLYLPEKMYPQPGSKPQSPQADPDAATDTQAEPAEATTPAGSEPSKATPQEKQ